MALDSSGDQRGNAAGSVRSEAPAARAGMERFYTWEPEGKSIRILLDFDVVDRLSQEVMRGFGAVPRRGAEVGGVLIGTVEASEKLVVHVQDFEPVPCPHKRGPSYLLTEEDERNYRDTVDRLRRANERGQQAIGYFRSHTRDGLGLSEEDLQLFQRYFPDPNAVILLIRPYATRVSMAGFFFEENGRINAEQSALEFPFRRKELGGGAPQPLPAPAGGLAAKVETIRSPAAAAAAAAGLSNLSFAAGGSGGSATLSPPSFGGGAFGQLGAFEARPAGAGPLEDEPNIASSRFKRGWVWLPLSFIFLMLGVLAGFFFAMGGRKTNLLTTSPDAYRLALAVRRDPGALHVTWDRSMPAIRLAKSGVLWINEGGPRQRQVPLQSADLQNGSVLVRTEGDATFRLEVFLNDGNRLSEVYEIRGNGR